MNLLPASTEVKTPAAQTLAAHYLLLGELRLLLEESSTETEHSRWMLAVLDRLLAYWPQEADQAESDSGRAMTSEPVHCFWSESTIWWRKLQRLRDRIAHKAPCQFLTNEIRCDLRALFEHQRVSPVS